MKVKSGLDKKIVTGIEALKAIEKGMGLVCGPVGSTAGPSGRCVAYESLLQPGLYRVTKDGVTVANQIQTDDSSVNAGVELIKKAARKTVAQAGDGTTATVVLTDAIFRRGMTAVSLSSNPTKIAKGIDLASKEICKFLDDMALKIPENQSEAQGIVSKIATISSNGDESMGSMIEVAIASAGPEGLVMVEESRDVEDSLDVVEGSQYNRGFANRALNFVTNLRTYTAEYKDCYVLVSADHISNIKEALMPALEWTKANNVPLMIIAPSFEKSVTDVLIQNKMDPKIDLKVVAVKAPYFGERQAAMLDDIAILTGAHVVGKKNGTTIKSVMKNKKLGKADKIIVSLHDTTIIGGQGTEEDKDERAEQIKAQIQNSAQDMDAEGLKDRLAKFRGSVCTIKVGGRTEEERSERKDRMDDAVNAAFCAIQQGIVLGGGFALVKASETLSELISGQSDADIQAGIKIVQKAILEPCRNIIGNADLPSEMIIHQVLQGDSDMFGYDVQNKKIRRHVGDGGHRSCESC